LIFKLESVTLFDKMVGKINDQTVSILMRGQIPVQEKEQTNVKVAPDPSRNKPQQKYSETKVDLNDRNQQAAAQHDTRENAKREPMRVEKTVGRNDPCPCGSGKKFKNCHGKNI
jgi:preprotein translocase subunit SecA